MQTSHELPRLFSSLFYECKHSFTALPMPDGYNKGPKAATNVKTANSNSSNNNNKALQKGVKKELQLHLRLLSSF